MVSVNKTKLANKCMISQHWSQNTSKLINVLFINREYYLIFSRITQGKGPRKNKKNPFGFFLNLLIWCLLLQYHRSSVPVAP